MFQTKLHTKGEGCCGGLSNEKMKFNLNGHRLQSFCLEIYLNQGCGNTMPDLSDLVPFHSGQVENFNLLVLGQVQNLYKINKILYFIF